LKAHAELWTPDGAFIRVNDAGLAGNILRRIDPGSGGGLAIGNLHMRNCLFKARIGIKVHKDGSAGIACA